MNCQCSTCRQLRAGCCADFCSFCGQQRYGPIPLPNNYIACNQTRPGGLWTDLKSVAIDKEHLNFDLPSTRDGVSIQRSQSSMSGKPSLDDVTSNTYMPSSSCCCNKYVQATPSNVKQQDVSTSPDSNDQSSKVQSSSKYSSNSNGAYLDRSTLSDLQKKGVSINTPLSSCCCNKYVAATPSNVKQQDENTSSPESIVQSSRVQSSEYSSNSNGAPLDTCRCRDLQKKGVSINTPLSSCCCNKYVQATPSNVKQQDENTSPESIVQSSRVQSSRVQSSEYSSNSNGAPLDTCRCRDLQKKEQITQSTMTKERKDDINLAIAKQYEKEMFEVVDRSKIAEDEASALSQRQKIEELESRRKALQVQVAKKQKEHELAELERKRKASQLAADEVVRRKQELEDRLQICQSQGCQAIASNRPEFVDNSNKTMNMMSVSTNTRCVQPCSNLSSVQTGFPWCPSFFGTMPTDSGVPPNSSWNKGGDYQCCCCRNLTSNIVSQIDCFQGNYSVYSSPELGNIIPTYSKSAASNKLLHFKTDAQQKSSKNFDLNKSNTSVQSQENKSFKKLDLYKSNSSVHPQKDKSFKNLDMYKSNVSIQSQEDKKSYSNLTYRKSKENFNEPNRHTAEKSSSEKVMRKKKQRNKFGCSIQ